MKITFKLKNRQLILITTKDEKGTVVTRIKNRWILWSNGPILLNQTAAVLNSSVRWSYLIKINSSSFCHRRDLLWLRLRRLHRIRKLCLLLEEMRIWPLSKWKIGNCRSANPIINHFNWRHLLLMVVEPACSLYPSIRHLFRQ